MPGFRALGDRLPAGQRTGGELCVGVSGDRSPAGEGTNVRRRRHPRLGRGLDPQNRWLGIDPTNSALVDERYITVGWGRDYADVPPLRGIIYTDSEYSVIDVSVDVSPCGTHA